MVSYYIIPLLVSLLAGTVIIYLVTKNVGFPNATLQNAFYLSLVWAGVFIAGNALFSSEFANTWFYELLAYFVAIAVIYKAPLEKTLILFAVSVVIRIAVAFTLGSFLAGALRQIAF